MSDTEILTYESTLPPGIPEDHGYKTLGWGVLDWGTLWLRQPDDHRYGANGVMKLRGEAWQYTDDQARYILWFYAVDSTGRFIYRHGYQERAKGVGKTPLVAAIGCTELLGPVRFSHWDENGEPVGVPYRDALVQLAAVSEKQGEQTMKLIKAMLQRGPCERHFGLEVFATIVRSPGGAVLEMVTSSPRTREGARPTFVIMEETHNWVPAENGIDFAAVILRNLSKLGGRSMEVTNAPLPGEGSVAEDSHAEAERIAATGELGGILFDSEYVRVEDIYDPAQALPALKWIYRNSPWTNIDDIFQLINRVGSRESQMRKFYFNELVTGHSGWLKKADWKRCATSPKKLKKTDKIALGFKSGTRNGAGALVACRLTDMALFLLGFWEQDLDLIGKAPWEVPTTKVDTRVRKILGNYDVYYFCAEPTGWADIIGRWAADTEDDGVTVQERWQSSKAIWVRMVEQFESGVKDQRIPHSDDPDLNRHILSCHIQETNAGDIIRKRTPDSKEYISAAQAAVLAVEAAVCAIEDGALKEGYSGDLWSY